MKHLLLIMFKLVLILLLLIVGYLNYSLYYQPQFSSSNGAIYNKSVYHQLQFLKEKLHTGAGAEMQHLFPEGFIFINTMYGLSWCNLIEKIPTTTPLYQEGLTEIDWVIQEINSPKGRAIFPKELLLEYGAFYNGWLTYLLGKKLLLQTSNQRETATSQLFIQQCQKIATALHTSNIPYLASYEEQVWPSDILPCMASLRIHDQLFEQKYSTVVDKWVADVKQKLDITTGLLPHSVDYLTGTSYEPPRGSSQSLILNFLLEIDEAFAQEQFRRYKALFVDSRFGLPGIREYPKGRKGEEDIDSGPVLLEIGGVASIVGQRVMAKYQHWELYEGLRNAIESFGVGLSIKSQKKYLFGTLPMADAFIAWSNSIEQHENQVKVASNWRSNFQLLSIAFLILSCFLLKGIK